MEHFTLREAVTLIIGILCFTGIVGHCQVLEMENRKTQMLLQHCEKNQHHDPACPFVEDFMEKKKGN